MKTKDTLVIVVILYIFTQFMWMYSMIIQRQHDQQHHMTMEDSLYENDDVNRDSPMHAVMQNVSRTFPPKVQGDLRNITKNVTYIKVPEHKVQNTVLTKDKTSSSSTEDTEPAIEAVRKLVRSLLPKKV